MAKKLSLSEAQLAASGSLPQQQDVMGDASAKKPVRTLQSKREMPAKSKHTTSEVVKTKADTIDGEEAEKPKIAVGKPHILDAEKVKQIITLSDAGSKPSELAKQFHCSPSHISCIVRGVTWSHVTGRYYQGKGTHWESKPKTQAAEKSAENKKGGK